MTRIKYEHLGADVPPLTQAEYKNIVDDPDFAKVVFPVASPNEVFENDDDVWCMLAEQMVLDREWESLGGGWFGFDHMETLARAIRWSQREDMLPSPICSIGPCGVDLPIFKIHLVGVTVDGVLLGVEVEPIWKEPTVFFKCCLVDRALFEKYPTPRQFWEGIPEANWKRISGEAHHFCTSWRWSLWDRDDGAAVRGALGGDVEVFRRLYYGRDYFPLDHDPNEYEYSPDEEALEECYKMRVAEFAANSLLNRSESKGAKETPPGPPG